MNTLNPLNAGLSPLNFLNGGGFPGAAPLEGVNPLEQLLAAFMNQQNEGHGEGCNCGSGCGHGGACGCGCGCSNRTEGLGF